MSEIYEGQCSLHIERAYVSQENTELGIISVNGGDGVFKCVRQCPPVLDICRQNQPTPSTFG